LEPDAHFAQQSSDYDVLRIKAGSVCVDVAEQIVQLLHGEAGVVDFFRFGQEHTKQLWRRDVEGIDLRERLQRQKLFDGETHRGGQSKVAIQRGEISKIEFVVRSDLRCR